MNEKDRQALWQWFLTQGRSWKSAEAFAKVYNYDAQTVMDNLDEIIDGAITTAYGDWFEAS